MKKKKQMGEQKYRMIMMFGLYLGLMLFVAAIILLAQNVKEISTDPIIYGMDKHDFVSCTCYEESGRFTQINLEDFETNKGGG
ncbi:MAG TPA: hypothetical protein ENH99_03245 [Candidatus Pacearchaeota archaeon]|nr:hypothetical protein [Candidatus Pacearchaeota archaeon]